MTVIIPDPITAFLKLRAKPARRYIGASVILSGAHGLLIIASAWVLAHIVDAVIFQKADLQEVVSLLCLLLLFYLLRAVLFYGAERLAFLGADFVKADIRRDILSGLVRSGPVAGIGERGGSVLNAYIDGVEALQGYYMQTLPSRMTATILPLAILLAVLPLDLISGLILLATAPLIPVFMIWIGRGAESLSQRQWRRMTYMGGRFFDVLQGLKTLKLFNASRREARAIRKLGEEFRHQTMAVLRIAFLSSLAMEFFATVSIALIAVLIGFRLLWGEIAFTQGFFVLLLAPEFYQPLRKMGAHHHAKMEAIGAAEKIIDLFAAENSGIVGTEPFVPGPVEIEFKSVSFSYDSKHEVLRDVTCKIMPGEKVALTGRSGSGKSTLLYLLMGFIKPQSGQIFINGQDLNAIDSECWRRQLAWMGQKPRLFSASIEDNILVGRPDASEGYIYEMLSRCGLDGLAKKELGENGSGISGGQAQRVALARALIKKAPLQIFDEPTAHLDEETEDLIQKTISVWTGSATVVFSAHRAATIAGADRILCLEDGVLREVQRPAP